MKSVNAALLNAIRTAYALYAVPQLTVDWNWNRYVQPTATNTPSDDDAGYDIEVFPLESIYDPIRPNKGIAKAMVNQAVVSSTYKNYNDPKFYIGDVDDKYKYWTSPYPTDGSGNFPLHTDSVTTVRPTISYPQVVQANKIIIRTENTWAAPNSYSVLLQTSLGGAFSAVGGASPAMDNASGVLTLYYNGTAWVTTRPTTLVTTSVAGITFQVNSMKGGYRPDGTPITYKAPKTQVVTTPTGANSHFNLISIEAHMEVDLSSRLVNVSDDFEMSNQSELYPIGTTTTNQASVTLSNDDGIFNPENTSSPYHGLLDANAEWTMNYVYTVGASSYSVQQFKMYNDGPWPPQDDGTIQMELEDFSKFLKDAIPNQIMYQNKTATELVWRLLDSIGFNNYAIQLEDTTVDHTIPVFWTDGTTSVWEILDDLATETQTAIYFDGNGVLQVRTREAAFASTNPVAWNLLGVDNGTGLADIQSVAPSGEYQANSITVTYKTTKWKTASTGVPAVSTVWQPSSDNASGDDTVVLRSAPLVRQITDTSVFMFLDQKEVKVWPFSAKVQVDTEIISYDGKQYVYYTGVNGGIKNTATVKSADDIATYNSKTPSNYRGKNYLTGGLRISERGSWNTAQRNHNVDLTGWNPKMQLNSGATTVASPRGFSQDKASSTATINTPARMKDANDTFWSNYGGASSTGYTMYGTRIRFNKDGASNTQRAGIGFYQSGSGEAGYYVELCLSNPLTSKDRKSRNEVTIYSKVGNNWNVLSKGSPTAVAEGIWYDIDVYIVTISGQHVISAWINGTKIATGTTASATKQTATGRLSMYARGKSNVSYDYVYGVNNVVREPEDDFGFYDLHYGGIRGDEFQREHLWHTRTRWKKIRKKKWKKVTQVINDYVFEEFTPYLHEIREFDVKFDPNPVNYSYLFSTNNGYATCVEYNSSPFGAKFTMVNTARGYAILSGEDPVYGADNTVNEVFNVMGQDLTIADDQTVVVKNDDAIRKHGTIDSELSGNWIQSKDMAQDVADWMSAHWSDGVDEISVSIFGNPLIEIGDVVDVNYPPMNMTPATHKYFVISVQNTFETGLSTTLGLRRLIS